MHREWGHDQNNPYISDVAKLKLGRGMIIKGPCDKMKSK